MQKAYVFDKARYHLASVREHGLPDHQANVHAGLFFGWAVDRGLVLPWVETGAEAAFAAFRARTLTGPQLFAACDGALLDDQFTDEGLAFVLEYYPLATGRFLDDYLKTLTRGLGSEFHVADTAENAAKLGAVLDERLAAFRQTWSAAAGRPDLRADAPAEAELPATLVLPVIPVTAGVVLPHGSIGIRAGRADTRAAVAAAMAGDRRVALVPTITLGKRVEVDPAELMDFGVVAEIEQLSDAADRPGVQDVLLACLARVELADWVGKDPLTGRFLRFEEPELEADDADRLDGVRMIVAELVRKRLNRGEPPGQLALCATASPVALLDLVTRELPASREEQLTVLLAPDLQTRISVVVDLLRREP